MQVKLVDLVAQYNQIKDEIDEAIHNVIDKGQFILGPANSEMEQNLAEYNGVKYALGCNSGTDALQLAMMARGYKKDDEIISIPMTFVATIEVMVLLGLKPVFVDVDPETYCIDPNLIEAKITDKTRAIIPVHLYGQSADMDPIMEIAGKHNLDVIEDCAQAIGATYKGQKTCTLGDAGCLSFFPAKNLGAYGDAGAILTDDDELAEKIKMIRVHGSQSKYEHTLLGINSRLDSIQAAVINVKLKYIDKWNELRRKHAARYTELLSDIPGLVCPAIADENQHVFHQYTIQLDDRFGLQNFLRERGIATGIHYPIPLHLQPAFKNLGYNENDFPISETVAKKVLSLPIYPELPTDHQEYVVEQIHQFYKN